MNTTEWVWLAVILGIMFACYTAMFAAWWYIKGQNSGRVDGYSFAKNPACLEFQGVAYSLGDVIQNGDYEAWRDSLEVEDLL